MDDRHYRFHGENLRKGRYSQPGAMYLVTTVTRGRRPVFADHIAARACARLLHSLPGAAVAENLAWVIMPDHVHYLLCLRTADLAAVMRRFKSQSAKSVNALTYRTGPLWQKGYHDHALRAEEDIKQVARYIIANPLRARLCNRVGDYPYWFAAWL
ncbi:MAG: transposase [Nitrococcus sp.]|nr:transposase [Nitrococcus sp.]